MRSRKTMLFLMFAFIVSTTLYLGAAEQSEAEKVAPEAPAEIAAPEADPQVDPEAALVTLATPEPAPDAFFDNADVTTMAPVNTVACRCQVGVNCCGDPGGDITCGGRNDCVCNGLDECILQHVHPK